MNQERLLKVLVAPHVSEKSTTVGDKHRQIVFQVLRDATKNEIKTAVEKLFNVKVDAVRTVNVKGTARQFKQTPGRTKDWKKAYVHLSEGSDINFLGAEG